MFEASYKTYLFPVSSICQILLILGRLKKWQASTSPSVILLPDCTVEFTGFCVSLLSDMLDSLSHPIPSFACAGLAYILIATVGFAVNQPRKISKLFQHWFWNNWLLFHGTAQGVFVLLGAPSIFWWE